MVLRANEEPSDLVTLSALWDQLPRESRCVVKHCPEAVWGGAENLLWSIEHSLRVIAWQNTKDGSKGRNQPKPVKTPAEIIKNKEAADHALANKEEIDRILGIRGEI